MNSRRIRDVVQIEAMDANSIKKSLGEETSCGAPEALTYVTDINIVYGTKLFFQAMAKKIDHLREDLQKWHETAKSGRASSVDEYSPGQGMAVQPASRKYSRALSVCSCSLA